ncbi:MAG TPA: glycosyltransferase family 39 protein [Candidatus Fermentibacter daniensis]|nr:glycosyltransferase family 39 protein [Candidatus Fermentibacter daniensis]HOR08245.1 glycosyltransferase family 39 protein [Candidatus Fermentibacter daniensis]HPK52666.1 glycosyltransferase family 39 protein [Candidatus Fermentibacter daniensis]
MKREMLGPLLLIFLFSAITSSFAAMRFSEHPSLHWDAAHYALLARNLVEGNGFSNSPGHPTAFRPPLYPAVVSVIFRAVGERYRAVYLLQAVLYALAATGLAWFAYRMAGLRSMYFTGILVAVNPSALEMTGMLMTETLFAFLLVCCLLLLYKAFQGGSGRLPSPGLLYYAGAGLLLGAATLCRPNAAGCSLMAAAVILVRRREAFGIRLASAAVLLLASALPVAPWMMRNNELFGSPCITTTGGINFWDFRHRDPSASSSIGTPPEEFLRANSLARQRDLAERGGDVSRMAPVYNICPRYFAYFYNQSIIDRFTGLSETEADGEYFRMGLEYTLNNPMRVLLESLQDVLRVFSPLDRNGRIDPVLFIALPFIICGMYLVWRHDADAGAALAALFVPLLVTSFLIRYEPRYRIPFEPLMLVYSSVGIAACASGALKEKKVRVLMAVGHVLFTAASYMTLSGPPAS